MGVFLGMAWDRADAQGVLLVASCGGFGFIKFTVPHLAVLVIISAILVFLSVIGGLELLL